MVHKETAGSSTRKTLLMAEAEAEPAALAAEANSDEPVADAAQEGAEGAPP